MADKPSATPTPGSSRATSAPDLSGQDGLPADFEVRLRSTEKVKIVLRRCERSNAPHHLLIRIRETLISISTRDGWPPSH